MVKNNKVIYIMGTARSGSTILEILLSNCEGVTGAGEITHIIQDGFIKNQLCACSFRFQDCELWGKIKSRTTLKDVDVQELKKIQKQFDWHSGLLRGILGIYNPYDMSKYKRFNDEIIDLLATTTGDSVIVDSSKYVGRAYALSKFVSCNLYVICLTRSPEGILASFKKRNEDEQKPKNIFSACTYYMTVLALLRIVSFLLGKKVMYVDYETLTKYPVSTLRSIGEWCEIDTRKVEYYIEENKQLDVGHIITGNRLRKSGRVIFRSKTMEDHNKNLNIYEYFLVFVMRAWKMLLRF